MSDSVDHRDGQSQEADSIDEVCLITISYKGDFDLAGELCTSIDRFAAPGIEHVLVVPRSDISRFARLEAPNRRVVAVEDVLQNGYYRLPTPSRIDVGRLYRRRIREVWRGPSGLIRGWIVQQIVKLSAPAITERQVIVFADSDIVLVRPLSAGMFVD